MRTRKKEKQKSAHEVISSNLQVISQSPCWKMSLRSHERISTTQAPPTVIFHDGDQKVKKMHLNESWYREGGTYIV